MNYALLNSYVENYIKPNDNKEITGSILQEVIKAVIHELGAGFQFAGIATPSTEPPTTDARIFYLCGTGDYSNFGEGMSVPQGSLGILTYGSSWELETIAIGSGSVTPIETDDIEDNAVTTDKIADESVTSDKLSSELQEVIATLGVIGFKFLGIAEIDETPATPVLSVFKIANAVGTYTGYGLTVSQDDGVCAFTYDLSQENPAWVKLPLGIPFPKEIELLVENFSGSQLTAFVGHYYDASFAVNTLNILLPAINDNTRTKSIMIHLVGGTTPNVQFSSADNKTISFYDGFVIESGKEYELNIMFNGSKWIVAYGVVAPNA